LVLARDYIHNLFLLVLITVALGALCGLFSGLLYVTLKLPPMIISLGVALLFEAFAYIVTSGTSRSVQTAQGNETMVAEMNNFVGNSSNFTWIIILTVTAVLLMVFIFNDTKFGHDYHALQCGQKIAVDTGIKEVPNAIWCYVISGTLVGLAACFYACKTTSTRPDSMLNFASVGVMFDAFCPLFFADFIRRYCKKEIAILVGVVSYEFLQLAFGNINSAHTEFTSTIYGIINSLILVGFLIYLNNEKAINYALSFRWLFRKKKEG
jgi:ribose transport system permease protein